MISNKLVMPEHLNPFGNLFGGTMMSWMDKIAAMEAAEYTKRNCVTAKVSEINFNVPVKLGDRIILDATVSNTGRTSLTVHVVAKKKHLLFETTVVAASADFVFVALGEDGKPDPSWKSSSNDDVFSAAISSNGEILSQSMPWIYSVTRVNVGVYSIKFAPNLMVKAKVIPVHADDIAESFPSPHIATNSLQVDCDSKSGFTIHAKVVESKHL